MIAFASPYLVDAFKGILLLPETAARPMFITCIMYYKLGVAIMNSPGYVFKASLSAKDKYLGLFEGTYLGKYCIPK